MKVIPSIIVLAALGQLPLSAQDTAPALPNPPVAPAEEKPVLEWDKERVFDMGFNPAEGVTVKILSHIENGTHVKKGDSIITVDMESLQNTINDTSRELEAKQLDLDNARFALEQGGEGEKTKLEQSQRNLTRLEEDMDDYLKIFLPNQLDQNNRMLERAEFNLTYKKENLRQLERMYKEDQITEESEEIILTRTRNELVDAEKALELARINHEWNKNRKYSREKDDKERALRDARTAYDDLAKKLGLDQRGRSLAVRNAEKKQADAAFKLDNLNKVLGKAKFEAPADGIIYWCKTVKETGVKASFIILPESRTLTAKMISGSGLKEGTPIEGSIVKLENSEVILPKGTVSSIEGDTVSVQFGSAE